MWEKSTGVCLQFEGLEERQGFQYLACRECLEILQGCGAHLRAVEAIKLFSFAPTVGMGMVSSMGFGMLGGRFGESW